MRLERTRVGRNSILLDTGLNRIELVNDRHDATWRSLRVTLSLTTDSPGDVLTPGIVAKRQSGPRSASG
jgi:hypothetical protein